MSNDLAISVSSLAGQGVSEVNSFGLKADFVAQSPVESSVLNNTGKALLVLDHSKHNRTGDESHTGTFIFQGLTTHNGGLNSTTVTASTSFNGPGTGLTGTGVSFTAGDSQQLGGEDPSHYLNWGNRGVANGVASLDPNGKVPVAQIPSSIVGAMKYIGVWNASSNTPALPTASDANLGNYYVVTGSGSVNGVAVNSNDWVVSDGASGGWVVIDNTDRVTSVNGMSGAVVLDAYIPIAQKNVANGVAVLDGSSRVTATNGMVMADATGTYAIYLSGGVLTQQKL